MKIVSKPVKMVAFFWPGNTPTPYKFKIADKKGVEALVYVDKVLLREKFGTSGAECIIYECQSLIKDTVRRYQLKYFIKRTEWVLYKI